MIIHPAIIALSGASAASCYLTGYAAYRAVPILARWDLNSGAELQLRLERQTYLISSLVAWACIVELISLFLFIFTADHLSSLFTGAMCAAGTLHVNPYGYPALLLKLFVFLLAGLWLILNNADNKGFDYPLIRVKYAWLLALFPFVVAAAMVQFLFFADLSADVITSCCGSLFSPNRQSGAVNISSLPLLPLIIAFHASAALIIVSGSYFCIKGKGGILFSLLCAVFLVVAAASLLTFICLYIYELPTHHCPFCLLQAEYGHIGYPLYLTLLLGSTTGIGSGLLMPFRKIRSIAGKLPALQRRLACASLSLFLLFYGICCWKMLFSLLRMDF